MANELDNNLLKSIISHCKEYGFIFPSSDIYDGLSATYDYGPNGVLLKNNIKNYWWESMVKVNENIVGVDAAIFMHPTTWKASGHVDAFNDPLIDNKDSKKRYRVDVLIEDEIEKIRNKISKEVKKASERFGDKFDENQFVTTNPRVLEYAQKIENIENKLQQAISNKDMDLLKNLVDELEIIDPISGTKNWTSVRQFNLMFSTELGSVSGESSKIYLRPETAQGIFVNFLNIQKTTRMKIPFGIAQIGKAFRNEIIARQFIFRMREFEQMEMQFFVKPGEEMQWYEYWKEKRMNWHKNLNLYNANYRYHDHLNLAHYANAACDIEFQFPFGYKEIEGIHSRTDFDLKSHEKYSGKKIQYFDHQNNESYTPYVIETSIGLDRMFLSLVSNAYQEEKLEDGSERTVLKIPHELAPHKLAILPLVNKDGLSEIAEKLFNDVKFDFDAQYDAKDTIGKRYRRQDAIGTPFCVTIDHQTIDDQTVTMRDRDSMNQVRIPIQKLVDEIKSKVSLNTLLKRL